jgi:DNA-binding IclR family transcriptional regulator
MSDALPSTAPDAPAERGPRGIQSVEVGGQLLLALAHQGRPLALQLGLISLQQYDPVRLATPRIEELAAQLGHTVAIAVWGSRGQTIVRVAEAPSPVHISMRHGTVMNLRGTASGRLFAAYLPRDTVQAALAAEAAVGGDARFVSAEWDDALHQHQRVARAHGIANSQDGVVQGVSALAAPVFDDQGRIVLSLTAIGPSGSSFDLSLDGAMAQALQRAGLELSRQLGWRGA